MIIILDKKQVTVGVAVNGNPLSLPYFKDSHYEDLEGVSTYEFYVPGEHVESSKLEVNGHVIIRDLDGIPLLFTIKKIQELYDMGKQVKYVFCENTAVSELLADVQRPINLPSATLESALTTVINSSHGWTLGEVGYTYSTDFIIEDYVTVLEALSMIKDKYSVEMSYSVVLEGTRIVEKHVNVYEKRGQETNVRFEYGYNTRGVSRTAESDGVITAIVAVGKGDSGGNRLTLTSLPSFDDGDFYHDGQTDWIGSDKALQEWSTDGSHIFGIYVDEDAATVDQLKKAAIKELTKRREPYLYYAVSVLDFSRLTGYESKMVRLGDTVHIKDSTYAKPIAISGRVKSITRSYTDMTQDTLDLGSYKTLAVSTSKDITNIQNMISRNEEKWNRSSVLVKISSTGGTVFVNGVGSTVLKAKIFHNDTEIDLDGTEYVYKWMKYGSDGALDSTWTKTGKSITISQTDLQDKATFAVEIE